jgi:alpha-mannosidase
MLADDRIFKKLNKIQKEYSSLIYEKTCNIPVQMCETRKHFRNEPGIREKISWKDVKPGKKWGGEWITAWFRGDITLPETCHGKKIFIEARTGGDTLLFINKKCRGVFDKFHKIVLMAEKGNAGESCHLAFEAYSRQRFPGFCAFDEAVPVKKNSCTFDGIFILLEKEDVKGFVFDLTVLLQLAESLDKNSLRKNVILRELTRVYQVIQCIPRDVEENIWRPKLKLARRIMKPLLDLENAPTMPWWGLVNHSHIDTAWIWPISETYRKCARTFSSMLNLMEQYPEAIFIQSSSFHSDMMRREYPQIFKSIQDMVKKGRWEPNGGMWVESDTNIPSGESLIRQFLIGQNATRKMFGYTSDTLWLPDVFGYSASLPQIMKGCGIEFFCTTKLDWNDTTRFPYDTFFWKGIDGSDVIAHFNIIETWADPKTLIEQWKRVQHKDVQDRRLCAMGHGDGGGGTMVEMLEIARRLENLEGCPGVKNTSVSDFMKSIRDELPGLPSWHGELYVEKHRGTLTTMGQLKRANRKAETALRDAEILCSMSAIFGDFEYPADDLTKIWKKFLVTQFHDILPGTSIEEVNIEAEKYLEECIDDSQSISSIAVKSLSGSGNCLQLINTLSWDRKEQIVLKSVPQGKYPEGNHIISQGFKNLDGEERLAIDGLILPGFGSRKISFSNGICSKKSPFKFSGRKIETPSSIVRFNKRGRIISFMEKESGRDIVLKGGSLNHFLICEDVPLEWDNWDIDADHILKLESADILVKREIVSDGPLQLRVRSKYKIGKFSILLQDMIFHSGNPRIDFESRLDWREKRQLLKVAFDIDILADFARHEIQFGYIERPTHSNHPYDRARFEVCAHKWTDLSENNFGVAILNDCKYGVSVREKKISLTLQKCGTHPDAVSDIRVHYFKYSILPHASSFSVENVVRPAYEFNISPVARYVDENSESIPSFLSISDENIIVDSIKRSEQKKNAYILRLYEAGKTGTNVNIKFTKCPKKISSTNMLEENPETMKLKNGLLKFYMRPFEIKTLLCEF